VASTTRGGPSLSDSVPIDRSRLDLANLYDLAAGNIAKRVRRRAPSDRAAYHREVAAALKAGILDLFWDAGRLAFYDFNMTANARNAQLTAAHWYPLWADIIPDEVQSSEEKAFGAFASLNFALRRYNGTYPATFLETGHQWGKVSDFWLTAVSLINGARLPELVAAAYILCAGGSCQSPAGSDRW
jgi:neutral trehalase